MSSDPVTERLHGDLPIRTADEAAATVPTTGTMLTSGFGSVGYPKAVPLSLAESDRDLALTLISGGSVGEEIDTSLIEADAVARRFPYQATSEARAAANKGAVTFHDRHVAALGDEIAFDLLADGDVAVIEAIAVGEDWVIPSTSLGHTPACIEAADQLIVEVNRAQPLALQKLHDVYRRGPPPNREPIPLVDSDKRIGTPHVSFDAEKLTAVVETHRRDSSYSFRELTSRDRKIGSHLGKVLVSEMDHNPVLEDTIHLQFGVGSLGNALMGELKHIEFGDRDVVYFGEVIQDGLLDLLESDHISTASATSLALSQAGQDRLFENMDQYTENVILRPADITNSAELINRFGVVAINSALEIDLYGHVNSTHINGTHVVNGIGGSGDFNRNGLISITALPSTTSNGDTSRIVPMVSHCDHSEHDIDIVVTEQGIADLRGQSPRERAELLVDNCVHPSFRGPLCDYLERGLNGDGHMPHDLDTVFDWH
jgi:succinyl-CoA:acetate CoA-transferase